MKDYIAAIEEIQEKIRPLQDEMFEARDKVQKVSSELTALFFELDKMKLAFLRSEKKK